MFNFYKKSFGARAGFTLIELMVVISIIGMLASIILAAVNTSRDRAKNAKIQSSIIQLRNAIELKRASDGTYPLAMTAGNTCGNTMAQSDPDFTQIISDLLGVSGGLLGAGAGPVGVAGGIRAVIYTDAFNPASGCSYGINANSVSSVSPGGAPTRFAIFAALGPAYGSNGYACVDSQGGTLSTSSTATFTGFRDARFMKGGLCQ